LDTSEQYGNEEAIAEALRTSEVTREDVFITTKFNARWHGRRLVRAAFEQSARRLGVEYIDLMLIHWPNPWLDRYVEAWEGLLELRAERKVRAVGVSNFTRSHISRLIARTGNGPEVNQIELDPTLPRIDERRFHEAHAVLTEAWGPLGRDGQLLRDPVVVEIAERLSRSPAQVVLRWHVQHGLAVAPRSSNPSRISENVRIFDFALDSGDLERLAQLDRGRPPTRDPDRHGH